MLQWILEKRHGDMIYLVQINDKWRALVNVVMDLHIP